MIMLDLQFFGAGYIKERDQVRLTGQALRIWECMSDGSWRTLQQISNITGSPESSVSATLRMFRRKTHGAHTIEREYIKNGLHKYKLIPNGELF
jgi:hypothetical protein